MPTRETGKHNRGYVGYVKLKPKTGDVSSSLARLWTHLASHNWQISQRDVMQRAKHHWPQTVAEMYFGPKLSQRTMTHDVLTIVYLTIVMFGWGGAAGASLQPGRFLQSKLFWPAPWTPGQKIQKTNFWQRTSAKESRHKLCITKEDGEWLKCTDHQRVVAQLCLSVSRCVNGCAGTSPSDALVHYCFCSLWACEGRYFQRCFETHGLSLQP